MDGDLISRAETQKAIDKLYLDGEFGIYNDGSEIWLRVRTAGRGWMGRKNEQSTIRVR